MKGTRFAALTVGLAVVGGSAARSGAADEKPVFDWVGGDTLEFRAVDGRSEARAGIAPAPGVSEPTFKLSAVTLDGRQDTDWNAGFELELVPDNSNQSQHLRITIKTDKVKSPGKYALALLAEATKKDDKGKAAAVSQRAVLYLIHPEATLAVIGELTVDRVKWIPFTSLVGSTTPPLFLEETGNRSHATEVTFTPVGSAAIQGRPAGNLTFPDSGKIKLAPRAQAPLRYDITRSELGTAKGTFRVDAPQMHPLTVPYEIRTRLSRFWLMLVVGFGVGLGFLGRVRAVQALARWNKLGEAATVEDLLDGAIHHAKDAVFKGEIRSARDELKRSTTGTPKPEIDAINDAVKLARAKLETAQNNLSGRRTAAAQALANLAVLSGSDWQLPEPIRALLSSQRAVLEAALATLNSGDVATVEKKLADVRAALLHPDHGLSPAVRIWRSEMEELGASLLALGQALPAWIAGPLAAAVNGAVQLVAESAIARDPLQASSLEKLQQARDLMRQGADWTLRTLRGEAARIRDAVAGAVPVVSLKPIDEPEAGLKGEESIPIEERNAHKLQALVDGLETVARLLVQQLDPETRPAVQALIDARTYPEACRRAIESRPPSAPAAVAGAQPMMKIGGAAFTAALERAPVSGVWHRPTPTFSFPPSVRFVVPEAVPPLAERRIVIERETTHLVSLQRALSAAVVLGMAFLVYGDTFVGTPTEIVGLFFYGFAADLTLESATALAVSKRR